MLFKENCAGCHALGGASHLNYPTLADDDWIWGGTLEEIEHTIRHGVRNGQDAEARDSIMPAFGADGILTRPQIEEVTDLDDGSPYPIITGRYDEGQAGWGSTPLPPPGTPLAPPTPIFTKLDPKIVDEELSRLEDGGS